MAVYPIKRHQPKSTSNLSTTLPYCTKCTEHLVNCQTFDQHQSTWSLFPIHQNPNPNPTSKIKNQTNSTFNLVFPPPYFLHKKICQQGSHSCNHPLQRHVLQPRFHPKVRCHEDEVSPFAASSNVFCITCSLYLLMNRVCHVWVKMGKSELGRNLGHPYCQQL